MDHQLATWVNGWSGHPVLDEVMLWASWLNTRALVWVAVAVVAAFAVRGARGWRLMGAWRVLLAVMLASFVANDLVKPLAARERPYQVDSGISVIGPPPSGSSFPSGHAATATAGAFALGLVAPGLRWAGWAFALLVLLSRLYIGVHYPTDIVAGALIGLACAWLATAHTPCYISGSVASALRVPR